MKIKILILLIAVPFLCFGQHRFTHLNIEDGLTENSVTDIFQDSEGYMWFSTQDGISQYDGYNFKNYNISNNDSNSLSDNYLWGFAEDAYGFIWVCSRNGLNRIDKKTGNCTKFYIEINKGINGKNQVLDIAFYKGDIYALISNNVYKIPAKSNYQNHINLIDIESNVTNSTDTIISLHKTNGELFFLQKNGLNNYSSKEIIPLPNLYKGRFTDFLKTTQNKSVLWFTNGEKLYQYNKKKKNVNGLNLEFDNATIYDIQFANNELWVATNKGVFIVKSNKIVYHITQNKEDKNGITSNFVASIHFDNTGKIWIGTAGNGINVYDPKQDRFKFLSKSTFGDDYIVRSMVQTKHNELLVCTGNAVYACELISPFLTINTFAQENITSVKKLRINGFEELVPTKVVVGYNGDIMIGTKGNDILLLDENLKLKQSIILNQEQRPTNVVSDIILTNQNEIWVATYYGVYVLDKQYNMVNSFLPYKNGLSSNYFLSVYEDTDNQIWLGSNNGIYKYLANKKSFKHYAYQKTNISKSPGFNFVCGFEDFGDEFLWMATYGGGLTKMNKNTETFQHFTTENGLPNNVCNGLLSDKDNNLWLNTNKGISKFDPQTEKITTYTREDGLHFNEFNLNSFYKNNAGELFFGTPVGIVVFNPADISESSFQPNIVFNDIDINYEKSRYRINDNGIHLYPKDKVITFHFAGLSYSKSPKIKYKYQLKGYNDDWVETNELKASYTSLPDGEFTFLVNTTNTDGVWNTTPIELKVFVHPPYYKTWWFISLVVLVLLVFVGLVIRHFAQKNIKKRLQELKIQQEIHQEKQRISRDLHDNIGAQITYLISAIDQEAYTSKHEQDVFDQLSDKARNVMTQLRQTIWLISKEAISLTDFSQKVRDYSTKTLSTAGINVSVKLRGDEFTILTPTIVSHLFRIIQEAHNNIIKHAKASEVSIEMSIQDGNICLMIEDDGVGIGKIDKLDDHFGLKNMEDRVTEMRGNFIIEKGRGGKGVKISIKVPLTN